MKKIFVTGTAGFIGYHLTKRLLSEGHEVVALDCINDTYDVRIKYARLNDLGIFLDKGITTANGLTFHKGFLQDRELMEKIFTENKFDYVVNLAAIAGLRYQFENAYGYVDSNLTGFVTLMETLRHHPVEHLVFASSSSVYGVNEYKMFKETDPVDHPASLYAATKRANELMAHSYSKLFEIPSTGLRFFNVYGTWGRPDGFMNKLADSIVNGTPMQIYEKEGKSLWRDYTYVSDIVEGIVRLLPHLPVGGSLSEPNTSTYPFEVFNIGHGSPVENAEVIKIMEEYLGKKGNLEYIEAPKTEVYKSCASTELLEKAIGYKPIVSVKEGAVNVAKWYKEWMEKLEG